MGNALAQIHPWKGKTREKINDERTNGDSLETRTNKDWTAARTKHQALGTNLVT